MERLTSEHPRSAIDELLAKRQPIHLGGMSDPFPPGEAKLGVSRALLDVLADYEYPTVISTKSNLFERDDYLRVLKRGRFIVQVSMSSTDDSLLSRTDVRTPGPSALLRALATLATEGIPTACRIQPLLPGHEGEAFGVIDACASVGVRHVAVEHLKLPIEKTWSGTEPLSWILGINLQDYFSSRRAYRIGREWILPIGDRLERILGLRDHAHSRGLTFGAADNDLLLLSDGDCCCSGIDLVPGFENFFRFNYTEAARRGIAGGLIAIGRLAETWCPEKSIDRYVNSRSRLQGSSQTGHGIREYVRRNWNGSPNGNFPGALHGVVDSGEWDEEGFRLYRFTDEVRALLARRRREQTNEQRVPAATQLSGSH